MADKETDLQLTVGAVADKSSADKAAKDIVKAVDSSVKGGRIEIPVDVTVPIDKTKSKLTKAQKDITTEISKMMSKGFSASGKDIDNLTSKFNEFAKTFDQAGKGRQNKIFREIRRQVESLQNSYKELQKAEKATRIYDTKTKNTGTKQRKNNKYNPDFGVHSKEEIRANEKAYKNRLLKGWQQAGPRGFKRNTGFDGGVATSRTLMDTERGGSYPSNLARQMKMSEIAAVKWMKKSLKVWQDEAQANLFADNALSKGSNKNRITDAQKFNEKANLTSNELTKILGGLENVRPDASIDAFNKYLEGTLKFSDKANQGYEGVFLALNKVFNRYFNSKGTLGITDGSTKGVGRGHTDAQKAIIGMIKSLRDKLEKGFADKLVKVGNDLVKVSAEEIRQLKVLAKIDPRAAEKEIDRILKGTAVTSTTKSGVMNSRLERELNELADSNEKNYIQDVRESSRERTADDAEARKNQEIISGIDEDLGTGFNTDAKADRAIEAFSGFQNLKDVMCPCEAVLQSILKEVQVISKNGIDVKGLEPGQTRTKKSDKTTKTAMTTALMPIQENIEKALVPIVGTFKSHYEGKDLWEEQRNRRILEADSKRANAGKVSRSTVTTTVKDPFSWIVRLKDVFADLTKTTANYKTIMAATSEEQDKMAAERVKTFGLNKGRFPAESGDRISFARSMSLWRGKDKFKDLFKDVNLSEGIKVDTTAITDKLAKALSRAQFKAQTGGFKNNLIAAATGGLAYAWQPSLEKSRTQMDGVNQIMVNIREAANDILQDIQLKESTLSGLKDTGDLKFKVDGSIDFEKSSNEAKTLVAQLEESKQVLASILGDVGAVDRVVSKTHGNIGKVIKQLGFTSPVLRKNNNILSNLNAGLDKTGKSLKFHTRLAEILNYSFQLMGRHIGQMFKNWMLQLNPITQIKKAFQDFMGYNVKWQRTMNVIKYNLRAILRPAMDWIAQKLVNIIGFFDIISMKIQAAFGKLPVSLFDQAAADAEKMKEELEAAVNVSAGFDELHDIGSDNSGANDLLGDIYKPQLPESWKKLAEEIGDLFAGLIKGDLGFGEVMKRILQILWDTLKTIAKTIWDWFKQTAIGKYITEHWKDILGKILAAFLAWKLLKIAGKLLWDALFGNFGQGAIGGLFSKLGGWILKALGATAFGRGIIEGITTLFTGSGGLISTLKSIFVGHGAITAFGAWGETLGALFAQSLLAAVGVAIGVGGIMKGFDMVADVKSYNIGLKEAGGSDKDKKSDFGGKALGTILGGVGGGIAGTALAGLATGGPIGLAIGAISGLLITSLAPAFEEAAVKAKEMNNEMLKIEQYEGRVQGAQTQVNIFDEQLQLLKQSLDLSTQSVYDQGEKLGISKARMDELVKATQDGTFTTDMLTGSETGLAGSLTDLAQKQEHTTEVTKKLEEAQKKLLKAQTELSIAQDVEAGNFEVAAARIEVAEAQGVYSTKDATAKRIQLYKQAGEEERENLLQNLTDDQRTLMAQYNAATDKELGDLSKIWWESSDDVKKAFLSGVDEDTQQQFKQQMNNIDSIVEQHKGFWQGVGDTLKEIFTFGHSQTRTYNGKDMAYQDVANKINADPSQKAFYSDEILEELKRRGLIPRYALGTNYVPNDGLAYLHQGEAVIPKKYNQPYQQGLSNEERNYMQQMMVTMRSLDGTMKQGINVNGQFVQRGSDLVATVDKTKSRTGADLLSNVSYAR